MKINKLLRAFAVFLAFTAMDPVFAAQIQSTTNTVTLNVTIGESVTLSCTPASVNFVGNGGTAQASAPISCVTSWNLVATRTTITTLEYFTTDSPVGGSQVTAGWFTAAVDGGAVTNFSDTSTVKMGISGYYGPTVFTETSVGSQTPIGTHTDTIQLALNSTGLIAAGSYSGTLNIVACAV